MEDEKFQVIFTSVSFRCILFAFFEHSMADPKILVCIDFDKTIIDCNTDAEIKSLLNGKEVPEEIESLAKVTKGWTAYMRELFIFMHKNNVSKDDYIRCLTQLPLVPGMQELLNQMHESGDCEIVILSDANSFFVHCILRHNQLNETISKVFTNPAEFDKDGCLQIREFQNQTSCKRCPPNLCKGAVLVTYIAKRMLEGVQFCRTLYIGDGHNDVCAALHLGINDYIFARAGYRLLRCLEKMPARNVKATIIPWETAKNIKDVLLST
ncbi:hypothetical protein TNIN_344831 [Trichonephila inaurata madagascariensis]|uniref:Pyridoxal phosphate phosphatase PHOSPHO2 n=1 Tax=Trichonephila inaurata madagascariensis TaxID=2747483 RepID=A0A8X7BVW2_9ARAC|nr:hypothetical protein TNIN_344831 [Trichonephila inaurata madagascariensis]